MLPWLSWALAGCGAWDRDPVTGYYSDYLGWWLAAGLPTLGRVLWSNVVLATSGTAGLGLDGLMTALSGRIAWLAPALALLLGLSCWVSILPQLRAARPLAWCLLGYLLLVCLWPWPPNRFLIPILPYLVAYAATGCATVLRFIVPRNARHGLAVACLGVVLAANVSLLHRFHQTGDRTGYCYINLTEETVHWSSYERVFDWVRTHTRPEDVVACPLDSMLYLYTGRRAIRPFAHRPAALFYGEDLPATGTVGDLSRIFERHRPRYLVHLPFPGFAEQRPFAELVDKLRAEQPDRLVPVYVGLDRRFVVFEIRSPSTMLAGKPNTLPPKTAEPPR